MEDPVWQTSVWPVSLVAFYDSRNNNWLQTFMKWSNYYTHCNYALNTPLARKRQYRAQGRSRLWCPIPQLSPGIQKGEVNCFYMIKAWMHLQPKKGPWLIASTVVERWAGWIWAPCALLGKDKIGKYKYKSTETHTQSTATLCILCIDTVQLLWKVLELWKGRESVR